MWESVWEGECVCGRVRERVCGRGGERVCGRDSVGECVGEIAWERVCVGGRVCV